MHCTATSLLLRRKTDDNLSAECPPCLASASATDILLTDLAILSYHSTNEKSINVHVYAVLSSNIFNQTEALAKYKIGINQTTLRPQTNTPVYLLDQILSI